jgi:hypothetical protein
MLAVYSTNDIMKHHPNISKSDNYLSFYMYLLFLPKPLQRGRPWASQATKKIKHKIISDSNLYLSV